jgi:hypothetical protein
VDCQGRELISGIWDVALSVNGECPEFLTGEVSYGTSSPYAKKQPSSSIFCAIPEDTSAGGDE